MDFKDLYQIEDEIERIQKTYEIFNEDTRLNRSKAARVEFLTNVRYIEKYLTESSKILDIGAGQVSIVFTLLVRNMKYLQLNYQKTMLNHLEEN